MKPQSSALIRVLLVSWRTMKMWKLAMSVDSISLTSSVEYVFLALTRSNLFLAADKTTTYSLKGRIIPQSCSDLDTIGQLFTQYLRGDLIATDDSVAPTGSTTSISWFSAASKTLSLDVILMSRKSNVCLAFRCNCLLLILSRSSIRSLSTTKAETYASLVGLNTTLARYQNPFWFSLQVI